MAQEGKEIVQALVERFPVCVTYIPVNAEVDFHALDAISSATDSYEIQPDRGLDPETEVTHAQTVAQGRPVAILIPGRAFDAIGTRHGKGAGWYDRFLAACPPDWIRIGLCTDKEFSTEPLVRQPWDEPMDYVVVQTNDGYTLYTTGARS